MGIQKRFRVHKTGETIQLHGIITDTSNLKVLDEMVSDSNVFDCSQVVSASWNGLLRLDAYLSKLSGQITLTHVPYHLFQYLRLLPNVGQKYVLGDIELTLLGSADGSITCQTRFLNTAVLNTLAHTDPKPFIHLEDGAQLIGRDSFICPARFGSRDYQPSSLKSAWYQQNTEQFDFWYDYVSFANITLSLAMDLVQSQESTLETLLKDIELGVTSIETSLGLLMPSFKATGAQSLGNVTEFVKKACDTLGSILEKSGKEVSDILVRMQLLAGNGDFLQADALYKLLREFGETVSTLYTTLTSIEEIGASTGQQISNLSRIGSYKAMILGLKPEAISEETLNAVRETMDIMDPLSEGDWTETRTEFLQHLEGVDQSLSKIIILLQGFDLLRQILEHRLHEGEAIQDFLKRGGADWRGTKAAVYSLVNRTLVTDQEKYSCEFFIPEAARGEDNNQKPGDILLF
ncbi:MAG TPA: hypothetical protein VE954_36430 [Oligoflexus sp.]|uniref:hypothetical protein n=1 Tax=Oligoflexus sp. TaxID=1971216 RepID=UPI002D332BA5|nr:hypothetical protein [Oligoflexus sp.]HYX38623.1 hypothetical protein [Oligoflexus sp.]